MNKILTQEEVLELTNSGRKLNKEEIDSILKFIQIGMQEIHYGLIKEAERMWSDTHKIIRH
jgi:hypothetical protein